MASILVECSSCQSGLVYRHGKDRSVLQRYRYRDCRHCFQLDYLYGANKPSITDEIAEVALNGFGIRNTGQVLWISIITVIVHLKNLPHQSFRLSNSTRLATKLA